MFELNYKKLFMNSEEMSYWFFVLWHRNYNYGIKMPNLQTWICHLDDIFKSTNYIIIYKNGAKAKRI